jgi:hypothetical protein
LHRICTWVIVSIRSEKKLNIAADDVQRL